jgi:hypothetical protein
MQYLSRCGDETGQHNGLIGAIFVGAAMVGGQCGWWSEDGV